HGCSARITSEPEADVPDGPATGAGRGQQASQGELSRRMQPLLDVLPDTQREIVVLRVVVGLSGEETAEAVGSTPGAVRVAQHPALGPPRQSLARAPDV